MEYREIVAVTGIGGLFQLITTKSDGAIVKSLADQSTKFIPARVHNVTPIESIEIYTIEENVRLHEVLDAMNKSAVALLDVKKADNNAIKAYFEEVFPSLDKERVYVSDMKKILKWFEILKANDLLSFEAYNQEAEATEEDAPVAEKPAKKAKAAKEEEVVEATTEAPAKKSRAKKAVKTETDGTEAAPAKKTARKKKTEE